MADGRKKVWCYEEDLIAHDAEIERLARQVFILKGQLAFTVKAALGTSEFSQLAEEAIDALDDEEDTTESQFGTGIAGENYHETSQRLRERLRKIQGVEE